MCIYIYTHNLNDKEVEVDWVWKGVSERGQVRKLRDLQPQQRIFLGRRGSEHRVILVL